MFTIPNAASAEDVTQAQPDSIDFAIMVAAFGGTGIVTGCAVTAQGTPNMTVAVAAGTVAVAGTQAAVTAGNVTITAANASNPRFDLIVANNAGALSAVAGTAAAAPVFPAIPANSVVLAAVRVPAAAASINTPKITDKRVTAVMPAPPSFTAGMMMPWAGSAAPTGWQLCDGTAISRTTYASLFALIGTTYGTGDGSTTFNVPDLRGRTPVGYAATGGHTDVSTLGANEGVALASRRPRHTHTVALTLPNHVHTHALTLPDHAHGNSFTLPNHAHSVSDPTHNHGGQVSYKGFSSIGTASGGQNALLDAATDEQGSHTHAISAGATGISVGNPTSLPAIIGAVGSVTSSPSINGTVGNPTSNPAIAGTVGVAGPTDSMGYEVVNFIIKT